MSYRDLRNFTEMMRALGYTRHISMENFRTPNFPLVTEILVWLLNRYDPNIEIPADIDTEQDRIIFVRSVAQLLATKAHLKLNTKKLYQADGYAVKELLKVTSLLYNAIRTSKKEEDGKSLVETEAVKSDLLNKLQDVKTYRQLASEITNKGATLYDLFTKEVDLRELRSNALAKQMDVNDVEAWIRAATVKVQEEISKTKEMIENVASDEVNLDAKIEKKKTELERNQKRLATLKEVRPAFMDEYERLEEELQECYESYMVKFRCLAYLERLLEEHEFAEKQKMEEREDAVQKMMEKLRLEDSLNVEVEGDGDNFVGFDDDDGFNSANRSSSQRPQQASRFATPALHGDLTEKRRKFGSMTGGDLDETDTQTSDSDLELIDGDDGESDIVSDEEVEIDAVPVTRKITPKDKERPQSDDDF